MTIIWVCAEDRERKTRRDKSSVGSWEAMTKCDPSFVLRQDSGGCVRGRSHAKSCALHPTTSQPWKSSKSISRPPLIPRSLLCGLLGPLFIFALAIEKSAICAGRFGAHPAHLTYRW